MMLHDLNWFTIFTTFLSMKVIYKTYLLTKIPQRLKDLMANSLISAVYDKTTSPTRDKFADEQ